MMYISTQVSKYTKREEKDYEQNKGGRYMEWIVAICMGVRPFIDQLKFAMPQVEPSVQLSSTSRNKKDLTSVNITVAVDVLFASAIEIVQCCLMNNHI